MHAQIIKYFIGCTILGVGIFGISYVYTQQSTPEVQSVVDIAANEESMQDNSLNIGVEIVSDTTEAQHAASPPTVVESIEAQNDVAASVPTSTAESISSSVATAIAEEKVINVKLRIIPIGASSTTYAVAVADTSTVYDVMQAAKAQGFTFKDKNFSGIGRYITKIAGIEEDKRAGVYWSLYVNGSYANVGASSARVHDGDIVTWKFEKK